MKRPGPRVSLRALLFAVLVVGTILAAYMYGRREGVKDYLSTPHDRAVALVQSLPMKSEEEACAVYVLAKSHEEKEPGFLANYTQVRTRNLGDNYKWAVIFTSPKDLPAFEHHYTMDEWVLANYRKATAQR